MRFTSQNNIKSKQTTKKIIALVFLVCFIIVSLISEVLIINHANNEHDMNGVEGSCAACAKIQSAGNLLEQFGMAVTIALFAFIGLFASIALAYSALSSVGLRTLVSLKIRINN